MTIKQTVETLTQTAVSTAFSAARHPIGTATKATGLVKDTAGFGLGLVRDRIGGQPAPAPSESEQQAPESKAPESKAPESKAPESKAPESKAPESKAPEQKAPEQKAESKASGADEDPRDHIPGPDLAAFPPPAPEDLPEPIVIEAE
jgi:hypothetical protein